MNLRDIGNSFIAFMARYGIACLRYSLAIIFIWFGILKPFNLSPVEELVKATIYWVEDKELFFNIIGWWEVAIGICLLFRPLVPLGLILLALQIPGTFMPLVVLPVVCFVKFPYALSTEGEFIIKNLLIISAALVVGGSLKMNIFNREDKKV